MVSLLATRGVAKTIPLFLLLSLVVPTRVTGQSPSSLPQEVLYDGNGEPFVSSPSNMINWKMPTLGGKQFWTDHRWMHGWKIQRNAVTGHFRLLDPRNVRYAWGTKESCLAEMERLGIAQQAPIPNKIVVLAHGLMRTSGSMSSMAKRIQEEKDAVPLLFEYASTRASIADHAAALREVLESIPYDASQRRPQIDFIAHSMGNIVIRRAIADWQLNQDPHHVLDHTHRMVMLGPPNQGATIAKKLAKTGLFGVITGQGGMELGPEWAEFQRTLATPPFPFAVIAGNREESSLQNPLVDRNSDFVVNVEEAKLDGMADYKEVPVLHSFLMDDPAVQEACLRFLKTGAFQ